MAVHHDERPTRSQLISDEPDVDRGPLAKSPQTDSSGTDRTVAKRIAPLLSQVFTDEMPVRFEFWDGSALGPEDGTGAVILRSARAVTRLICSPDELGLVRGFITGDIDLDGDLYLLLRELRRTTRRTRRLSAHAVASGLFAAMHLGAFHRLPPRPNEEIRLTGRQHSRRRDSAAISHHYDVGNDFYELVLGRAMTYSCARFATPELTLVEAQRSKHDLICKKLGLGEHRGARLLDVGCGWGSLALHAAETYDASVLAITISTEQAEFARARVRDAGLEERVEVRLQDYRALDGEHFDAISSIGMFEHVGSTRMNEYFAKLFSLLNPRGRLLNHAISTPGGSKIHGRTFMNRYVFPDGELIDVAEVVNAMERAGFEVRDVESLREHYAQTLHAWVENLETSFDQAVQLVGEPRARVWRLYMAASANGFDEGHLAIHQVLGVAPGRDGTSGMPATRVGWN